LLLAIFVFHARRRACEGILLCCEGRQTRFSFLGVSGRLLETD
jgi:hypothetical protein